MLLYGVPGCGKTLYVHKAHPDSHYIHEPGSQWFDGYEGQDAFCLDDFAGSASGFRLDKTLVLLDKYTPRLAIKGSHTYLTSNYIYITTNIHPIFWYKWAKREVQYKALARRIDDVVVFHGSEPRKLEDYERDEFWSDNPYGDTWGDITVPMPSVE